MDCDNDACEGDILVDHTPWPSFSDFVWNPSSIGGKGMVSYRGREWGGGASEDDHGGGILAGHTLAGCHGPMCHIGWLLFSDRELWDVHTDPYALGGIGVLCQAAAGGRI